MPSTRFTLPARVAVAACLGFTLSGCTVEAGSVVGLSVSADGHLLAVVAVCKGYLDGVSVYSGEGSEVRDDGRWQHTGRFSGNATLDLQVPDGVWTTKTALALDPARRQSIYGWTKDNRWSAVGPDFHASDLNKMRTGQVWIERVQGDGFITTLVPMAKFHESVCHAG